MDTILNQIEINKKLLRELEPVEDLWYNPSLQLVWNIIVDNIKEMEDIRGLELSEYMKFEIN